MSRRTQAHHHQDHILADELAEKYHPAYVNAFIEARHYPGQTIEEWTAATGAAQYGSAQIYKPLSIGVSISGPSDNLFAVDCSKVDWHPRLVSAVKDSLVSAGKATAGDSVTLMDVCGQEISADTSASALKAAGVIYPAVKGTRILRSPLVGTEMQAQTPASHQTNRESLLKSWIEDVCSRSSTLIANALTDAKNPSAVDDILFGEGSKVKAGVVSLVQSSIPSIMEMFADPSKKQETIVQEISEKILGSVEKAYQTRSEDLVTFFNHQQAKMRSPAFSKVIGQDIDTSSSGKRSIFSSASKLDKASAEKALIQSAISNKMEILYPTQMSLHRDILTGALAPGDGKLVAEIGHCVCSRVPSHRGAGGARRRLRDGDHHGLAGHSHRDAGHHEHEHAHHDGHSMEHHRAHHHHSHAKTTKNHMASFKDMLGVDRYIEAIASKNALAGIPPSPGFAPIEGRHYGKHHSSEHYAKKRQPLTDRVSAAGKMREMPEARMMPEIKAEAPKTVASPIGRQMPGLEKESFANVPVGREMPALETPPVRVAAEPVGRSMPALEVSPTSTATIGRAMPSLEKPSPVAASVDPVQLGGGRIRHQPAGTKQLPQINI